jgi:glycerophosphoryl diester phosphodiesterase
VSGNVWLERRVINFAHQGGSFEAPSSTLAAIEHALEVGADAIELDVHATKDRVLVVCHDATIDRTTNGSGWISELAMAELEDLDNAYWFIEGQEAVEGREDSIYHLRGRAPGDRRFGVARLEEVLASFPDIVLNLDIKRSSPDVEPYEELLARTLAAHRRIEDVIVASFLDSAVERFRELSPGTPTAAATLETASFLRAVHAAEPPASPPVVAFQVPERIGGMTMVDQRFVDAAHELGVAVHVWTVNEREAMDRLATLGVDGIFTDLPSLLEEVLGDSAWDGSR